MPTRSIQKDDFQNSDRIKSIKKSANKRYINGHLVEVNSKSFKIQNAASILRKNDVLPVIEPTDGDDIFMPSPNSQTYNMDSGPFKASMDSGPFKAGFAESTENKPANIATSIAVLAAIGVTMVGGYERDHSFLSTQESMPLNNKNIVQVDNLKSLKNKNIKTDNNFKDSQNPFYNLDEGISQSKHQQVSQVKNSIKNTDPSNVVASIFDLNIVNGATNSLRQFK